MKTKRFRKIGNKTKQKKSHKLSTFKGGATLPFTPKNAAAV